MSAKVLLVANQKGGAGKTTLTSTLAVEAVRRGARVLMVDLDPQQSLRSWWNRREAKAPMMLDEDPAPDDVPAVIGRAATHFDFVIIDTPPATPDWLRRLAEAADLTLIPVKPSFFDLGAAGATVGRIGGRPWAFVLVETEGSRSVAADLARKELAQHGRIAPAELTKRSAYRVVIAGGQTAAETNGAASHDAGALGSWVWNEIEAPWRTPTPAKKGMTL